MQKFLILSIAIFAAFFILYNFTINYFFFQDDFFEINISKAENLKQYIQFFKFRDDIIAYRPISLQNYFFISKALFDLNPVGFRTITFLFLIASCFLISKVMTVTTGNFYTGVLTSLLWLTSSIHFMTLAWIAAAYNIIGAFFWLLTSFFFLKFSKSSKNQFYLFSVITFLVTIGSFEFSITWPAIFGFYYFYLLKNALLKSLKVFSPFIIISIIYLILRSLFIKIPQIPEYALKIDSESPKALFWYLLWSFNIPEEFKKQVVTNLLIFNSKFLKDYWSLVATSFTGMLTVIALGVIYPYFKIARRNVAINWPILIFAGVWFLVGSLPVLVLPNHTFTMYLTLSSIGIYLSIAYLLSLNKQITLTIITLVVWILTSANTLRFYKINSWINESQKFAKEFTINMRDQYPYLPANSTVFYPLSDHRHLQTLLGKDALQVIYDDPTLSIYYNREDLLKDYKRGLLKGPVYIASPR